MLFEIIVIWNDFDNEPTVEACFMELRSLFVGAPQGDLRTQKDLKH